MLIGAENRWDGADMAGVHEGHRERIRQRIEKDGISEFQQHELLEYLLYYAAARGDMNPVAHALIDRFGSLDGVLKADVAELRKVAGVGAQMAEWIRRLDRLMEGYRCVEADDRTVVTNLRDVRDLIRTGFAGVENEEVWQLCMGANGRMLVATRISDTAAWGESGVLRDALSEVLSVHACSVVLVQFTGEREPLPEEYDILHTCDYARTLKAVDVHLLDHVLVKGEKSCSMIREHYLEKMERPVRNARMLMEQYLEEE